MSNDSNYIDPKHNAFVNNELPTSKDKMWCEDNIREAVKQNVSNDFTGLIQLARIARDEGFPELADIHLKGAMDRLMKDIELHIEGSDMGDSYED